MNELATTAICPAKGFPSTTFTSTSDYFQYLMTEHKRHLWTERNICGSPTEARDRYISRLLYTKSSDKHCVNDSGPFNLFCDDFRPQNILVDLETLRIKAVLALEFTNAMPRQFASDAPWWLLLVGLDSYLLRDRTLEEFVEAYEPRLEHFLQVMERVEGPRDGAGGTPPLSKLMRESWDTKRFWFNYAAHKPFYVEVFFDKYLNESNAGIESLDGDAREGLEPFVEMKMKQLRAYDDQCSKAL